MEKTYYTIDDIVNFLKMYGIKWFNEDTPTYSKITKVEGFMVPPYDTNFSKLDIKKDTVPLYFNGLYGRENIFCQMFINSFCFVITVDGIEYSENPYNPEVDDEYNYKYIDKYGELKKVNRRYYNTWDDGYFNGLGYEDLSELWVYYLAKKYPQTYFQKNNENLINYSFKGIYAIEKLSKICKSPIYAQKLGLLKFHKYVKEFQSKPQEKKDDNNNRQNNDELTM